MRIFLIVLTVVAVLAVGLLFAAPSLVDAGRYRSDIEAVATRAAGQPVQLNGNLSFSIIPTPRLVAEAVIIAPPAQNSDLLPLLKAERAEFVLSLSDLLSGRYTADRVVIVEPEITVHTNLAGHSNLVLDRHGELPARNIRLQAGGFTFRDERRGRTFQVSDFNGEFSTAGAFDTRTIDLTGVWQGRESRFSARITSSDRPAISAELSVGGLGKGSLKGRLESRDDWLVRGELSFGFDDLATILPATMLGDAVSGPLPFNASGQAEIAPGILSIEGMNGEIAGSAFGARLSINDADVPQLDVSLAFEQLSGPVLAPWLTALARNAVSGGLGTDLPDEVQARLQFDAGLVEFPSGYLRQLTATARYDGDVLLVDRLAMLLPGGSDFAFTGDVRLSGGAFRLSGRSELSSDNLAALLEAAEAPVASGGHGRLRNFGLSAEVLVDSSVAQISGIDLSFDQSRITGGLAVALVRRPSFSANLTIDQLNANAYAGLFDQDAAGFRLFVDSPDGPTIPLLGAFDSNAAIRIGRLITGGSVVRGVELDAALIGGVLDLKSLWIEDIDGASVALSGRIDTPENPQWLLQGEVRTEIPFRLLGGLLGEAVPVLRRTGSLEAKFGLEGGPVRSAADITIATPALDVSLSGLLSNLLGETEFDLDGTLSAPRSRVAIQQLFPEWRLPTGVAGPLLVEGQLTGRPEAFDVSGKIDLLSARAEVAGRLERLGSESTAYDLTARVRHGDIARLMETLNGSTTDVAADPASLDLVFTATGDSAVTTLHDVSLLAGDDRLNGELQVVWGVSAPSVRFVVLDGALTLDRFMGGSDYGASAAVAANDRALRWSRLPLDWPWMESVDLKGEVRLSDFMALGLPMTDVTLSFEAGSDGWRVQGLHAALGQGEVSADITMKTRPLPAVELSASARNVALPELLDPLLGLQHEVGGSLSLDLRAQGQGLTEHDLIRSLSGELDVRPETSLNWPPEILIDGLGGRIELKAGVAKAKTALAGTSAAGASRVVGSVDLGDWLADIEVRPSGNAGADRISVTGPLNDLTVR